MIVQLKQQGRLNSAMLLAAMSIFSLALSLLRYFITGSKMYLFLNWNLFLAFIPWMLSTCMVIYDYRNKVFLGFLLTCWLLFFPNSPYILTDLFHLKTHSFAPVWFDWALILAFAWTGLMFGFTSLADIERVLSERLRKKWIVPAVMLLLFISGFGVYVGRFLRWNSWDVLSSPVDLGEDVLQRILHPLEHSGTWAITLLTGTLLNMMYFSMKLARS